MKRILVLFVVLTVMLTSVATFTAPTVFADYSEENLVYQYDFDSWSTTPTGSDRCLQGWTNAAWKGPNLDYKTITTQPWIGDETRARVTDKSGGITFDFKMSRNNTNEYSKYYITAMTTAVVTVIALPGQEKITASVWNDSTTAKTLTPELMKEYSFNGWNKYVYKIDNISGTCANPRYLRLGVPSDYVSNSLDFADFKLYNDFNIEMITESGNYALSAGAETSYTNTNDSSRPSLANRILLEAKVSDSNKCQGVEFYADNKKIGDGKGSGDGKYSLSWRTAENGASIKAGVYTVKAVAKTSKGSVYSAPVTMTIEDTYDRQNALTTSNATNRAEGGILSSDVSDDGYITLEKVVTDSTANKNKYVEYDNTEKAYKISAQSSAWPDNGLAFNKINSTSNYSTDIYEIFFRIKMTGKASTSPDFNMNLYGNGNNNVRSIMFNNDSIGYLTGWNYTASGTTIEFKSLAELEYDKIYDIKVIFDSSKLKELVYIDGKRVTDDWIQLAASKSSEGTVQKGLQSVKLLNTSTATATRQIYIYAFSCNRLKTTANAILPESITAGTSSDLTRVPADTATLTVKYPSAITSTNLQIKNGDTEVAVVNNSTASGSEYTYSLNDVSLSAGTTYQLYVGGVYIGEMTVANELFKVNEVCRTDLSTASGSTVTGTVKYTNNSANGGNAVIILALYKDGGLVKTYYEQFNVLANEHSGEYSAEMTLPSDFDKNANNEFKVFCFKDFATLAPLAGTAK